jgi:eukaryotic-like serine/threonine-protein kinase
MLLVHPMAEKDHSAPLALESRGVVAHRYLLLQLLGRGGNGEVWDAEDLLGNERVAVKLLNPGSGTASARVRREISALRLLRIPGVVRLFDEGVDCGRPFLVMERIDGVAFPGPGGGTPQTCSPSRRPVTRADESEGVDPAPEVSRLPVPTRWRSWESISDTTVALLETLARIHGTGVIHRDLKPANVLVNADGRPTVLDFGLSFGARLGEGLTEEGLILGTPAYLAPEQIGGDPLGAWTDLYALGVMLYEVLSGQLPHDAKNYQALLIARMTRRPAPLETVAPDVPVAIAELIDLLLGRSVDERPRSAGEVLKMLHGQPMSRRAEPRLPRLGGDAPVQVLVETAREGRSADAVGPPGSGLSRCLAEAAEQLAGGGHRVVWARPARRPFGSIDMLCEVLDDQMSKSLPDVTRAVELRICEALSAGTVILIDDAEPIDRWSAAALAQCRTAGPILWAVRVAEHGEHPARVWPVAHLAPLTEAEIRPLFAGPDRIFHLRTDAARALWTRTGGLQARVADEVTAWVRAGIARWTSGSLAIDRDSIDRLDAGLRMAAASAASHPSNGAHLQLSPNLEDLLAWMTLAFPRATTGILCAAMEQPAWRVEAELDELVRQGAARRLPGGGFEPLLSTPFDQSFSPERRRAAHRALARVLPLGADGRLLHLLAGQDESVAEGWREIAAEALNVACRLAAAGHLGQALMALREGVLAVRQRSMLSGHNTEAPAEALLLRQWVEIALSEGTPHALDRVLYELCRSSPRTGMIIHIESLVRAALAGFGEGERALDAANAVPPFADPDLERRRQGLRAVAARRCSLEQEAAVLEQIAAWADRSSDPRAPTSLAGWLGWLRYRQNRFDEAAELHATAAVGERWMTDRIFEISNTASCLLEAFRHSEAAECARTALELAQSCRHAYYEARAEWLLRGAAYRTGATDGPDLELVETVSLLGVPMLEALVSLNEAAAAWRATQHAHAVDLARRAHHTWLNMGYEGGTLLARCLALAAGEIADAAEVTALARRAMRCTISGIGAQALGLLGMACPTEVHRWKEPIRPLTSGVAPSLWGLRMDVLSIAESLAAVGA